MITKNKNMFAVTINFIIRIKNAEKIANMNRKMYNKLKYLLIMWYIFVLFAFDKCQRCQNN